MCTLVVTVAAYLYFRWATKTVISLKIDNVAIKALAGLVAALCIAIPANLFGIKDMGYVECTRWRIRYVPGTANTVHPAVHDE